MTTTSKTRMMIAAKNTAALYLFLLFSSCFQVDITSAFLLPVGSKPPTPTTTTTKSTDLAADRSFFDDNQLQQEEDNRNGNVLATSNLPGNYGFDPLHLASSEQQLVTYRKAEMKHARLAILAVMAILWSDLHVVDKVGATPFFEGRAFPEFLGACVGFPAALELTYNVNEEQHHDDDDPFHLYPASTRGQQLLQLAEIMTGRVCMIAAATRLTQYLLVGLGILEEDENLLSLLVPSAVQTTLETTMEEVIV